MNCEDIQTQKYFYLILLYLTVKQQIIMMSYYTTPRRRHSSLFQRMENQIKKISKKLSAAKESYKGSASKIKNSHLLSYNSVQDRNPPTVRKGPEPSEATQPLKPSKINLKRNTNHAYPMKVQSLQFEQPFLQKTYNKNVNTIVLRLHDQNSRLSYRLGRIQQICQDQSYKIGYMKAELKQTSRQLSIQKEKQFKQTCYLNSLLQYYKSKAVKYKKMLKQSNEVSIDLATDSNM